VDPTPPLRAPYNDLTKFPPSGRKLIFEQSDLESRWDLCEWAEREYDDGNMEGAVLLFHAEYYLADRDEYQRNPTPPNKVKLMFDARNVPGGVQ
jgi:hypothetical protein